PTTDREVGALSLCISQTAMKKIRERMISFQKEILELAGQDSLPPETIYQLNLQLFPLTTNVKDK
ncbi:MAG: DUF4423 domain-containing protein, partial [Fibrobacteres bacterium]|nr:DUF4423 domain-containing protein [Fibrobacterota bacterium]